jgi:pimeloyl-ACP methyl ester carboxylesterase
MTSPRQHILVIHGALGSAAQMQPVADALASLGEIVTVELPGHGHTPLSPGAAFSTESFVGALATQVARLRDAAPEALPPIVFGYSMGGYVALALEAQQPGSLGAVLTLGTKFEWTREIASREAGRLDPTIIEQKVPKFAQVLEQRHVGSGGWQLNLRNTAALLRALGGAPLLNGESLPRVRIPVLVAVGSRDDTVTAAEAERTAALMGNASSTVIDDTPHPIERVPVAEIERLLRRLVAGMPTRPR